MAAMLTHACCHHENCNTRLCLLCATTLEMALAVSQGVDGGKGLEEWWVMHSSVYRSHCLPAGHHAAAEQCTLERPTRFPWHICRNTVVWHGSSFVSSCKDLYAHCSCNRAATQLMQDARNHNKRQMWTCLELHCLSPSTAPGLRVGVEGWLHSLPPPQLLLSQALAWHGEVQNLLFRAGLWDLNSPGNECRPES